MLILLKVQCPEVGEWLMSSPGVRTWSGGGEWIETMSRFILILTHNISTKHNFSRHGKSRKHASINCGQSQSMLACKKQKNGKLKMKNEERRTKQAGAELCQAQGQLFSYIRLLQFSWFS